MNEDKEYLKELVKPVLPVILSTPGISIASYCLGKIELKYLEAVWAVYNQSEKDYKKRMLKKLKYLRRKDAQKLRRKRKKRKMKERKR